MKKALLVALSLTLLLALVACGQGATPETEDTGTDTGIEAQGTPQMMGTATGDMMATPMMEMTGTMEPMMTQTGDMTDTMEGMMTPMPGMTGTMESMMTPTGDMTGTMEPMMTPTGDMTGTMEPMMTPTTDGTATPGATTDGSTGTTDVLGALEAAGGFTTLITAIRAAGLEEQLAAVGPFTLFAPNDQAFASLAPETLSALLLDPTQLGRVLLYHLVPGQLSSSDVSAAQTIRTAQGSDLTITTEGGTVRVNNATVVTPDLQAGNATIHVIDTVLTPPSQ